MSVETKQADPRRIVSSPERTVRESVTVAPASPIPAPAAYTARRLPGGYYVSPDTTGRFFFPGEYYAPPSMPLHTDRTIEGPSSVYFSQPLTVSNSTSTPTKVSGSTSSTLVASAQAPTVEKTTVSTNAGCSTPVVPAPPQKILDLLPKDGFGEWRVAEDGTVYRFRYPTEGGVSSTPIGELRFTSSTSASQGYSVTNYAGTTTTATSAYCSTPIAVGAGHSLSPVRVSYVGGSRSAPGSRSPSPWKRFQDLPAHERLYRGHTPSKSRTPTKASPRTRPHSPRLSFTPTKRSVAPGTAGTPCRLRPKLPATPTSESSPKASSQAPLRRSRQFPETKKGISRQQDITRVPATQPSNRPGYYSKSPSLATTPTSGNFRASSSGGSSSPFYPAPSTYFAPKPGPLHLGIPPDYISTSRRTPAPNKDGLLYNSAVYGPPKA